jgi:tetratricopeptide (TPR) repeat protein
MPRTAAELERSAYAERKLGNVQTARKLYEEAAALYRAEANPRKVAHTIRHVADIHRGEGCADLAAPLYNEALAIYRSHAETSPLDLANAIRGLTILKSDAGESEAARELWAEARDLYRSVDVQAGVAECTRRLGD